MRRLIAIAAALIAIGAATPSLASVTVSLKADPVPAGPVFCPFVWTLTATVTGVGSDTSFTYTFAPYPISTWQLEELVNVYNPGEVQTTLAPGQSLSSHSSWRFDKSASLDLYFLVDRITPAQPNFSQHSPTVSITCSNSAPNVNKVRAPGAGAAGSNRPPAPTGVHVTTDASECAAHASGISLPCNDTIDHFGAVIVFNWQGSASDVDGFRAYNVNGHVLDASMTSPYGGKNTVVFKQPPIVPACYVIRAYKGLFESDDSQQVCVVHRLPVTQHLTH